MSTKKENIENEIFLADWIAGKITDADFKKLVSKEDYLAYTKIREAFNLVEKPKFNAEKSFFELKTKLEKAKKEPKIKTLSNRWYYAIAASIILFVGIYQFTKTKSVETNYGQKQLIALNEGTQIHLNAKSSILFSKYQSQRNVKLIGEAFFEVTKKGDFTVSTKMGDIHVLGTKFNVICRDDFFEVICYEGKVAVNSQGKESILTKNKAWRLYNGKQESWDDEGDKSGWLTGESNFISVPISVVFKAIENQYAVKLKTSGIDDTTLFTGSFTHKNLNRALKSICIPLGLDFKKNDNVIVLLKK
jgi:ferric-dicitrate binding protein FerR (iron transport regulator)